MRLALEYHKAGMRFINFWFLMAEIFHGISIPDMKAFFQKRFDPIDPVPLTALCFLLDEFWMS